MILVDLKDVIKYFYKEITYVNEYNRLKNTFDKY